MTVPVISVPTTSPGWFTPADCRLEDFRLLVEQDACPGDYPHAAGVRDNVLIYGERIRGLLGEATPRRAVQAELARALWEGPGIVVFTGAFEPGIVD